MTEISFVDFYPYFYEKFPNNNSQFFEAFVSAIGIKKPVIVYSVFGNEAAHMPRCSDKKHVHISWSGEPFAKPQPTMYDLNINMNETNDDTNTVCIPYMLIEAHYRFNLEFMAKMQHPRKFLQMPRLFCCQVTSNNNHDSHVRNMFYFRLQQRVPQTEMQMVYSMGRNYNNVGFTAPENGEDGSTPYFDLLSTFRFMICFENSSQPYYLTEKIMNAWISGTIPIYWGCSKVLDWLNPNAFLHLENTSGTPFPSIEDMDRLIERVLQLDQDHEAYKSMWEQPLITSLPKDLDVNYLIDKCRQVLMKNRPDAFV